MTPENQTHNKLKYKQEHNLFIFSEKHCSFEMCLLVWQNILLTQADVSEKLNYSYTMAQWARNNSQGRWLGEANIYE